MRKRELPKTEVLNRLADAIEQVIPEADRAMKVDKWTKVQVEAVLSRAMIRKVKGGGVPIHVIEWARLVANEEKTIGDLLPDSSVTEFHEANCKSMERTLIANAIIQGSKVTCVGPVPTGIRAVVSDEYRRLLEGMDDIAGGDARFAELTRRVNEWNADKISVG